MNIDELKLALKVSHESGVPLFIWGNQGIGKSQGVRQYASSSFHFMREATIEEQEEGTDRYIGEVPYGLVDLRCSQMEASEIRGLPDKDDAEQKVVYFAPGELPRGEWINREGHKMGKVGSPNPGTIDEEEYGSPDNWTLHRGVLLFDEVNRSQDDVLQAIFQIVYDRCVGEYILPTGWIVTAAGNPSSSKFTVNSFVEDAAFKDRFCHVFIEFDEKYYQSWVGYMTNLDIDPDIMTHVTQFCLMNPEHLNRSDDDDRENFVITPSSRSWEFVSRIEQAISNISGIIDPEIMQNVRRAMVRGLVGDLAGHYIETSIEILPMDIIKHGLTKAQIELIARKYARNQIQALAWGVANHAKKLSTKHGATPEMCNVIKFGKWILERGDDNRDLAVAFFDIILEQEQQAKIRRISFANDSLGRLMTKMKKTTPWYELIYNDEKLQKLLYKSHRGQIEDGE